MTGGGKEDSIERDSGTTLLLGATGLVGGECLRLLASDPRVGPVSVIGRRPLPVEMRDSLEASRVEEHVIDFEDPRACAVLPPADQVVCALGTTIRKAGSQERFRRVDHDYPLAIARHAVEHGARHFLLVSALGANSRSRVFYNRVKGELEESISALPYRSVTIVRPSLLLGERPELRLGEEIGKRLSFLVPGRYRPVAAASVAAALVQAALDDLPGRRIIESEEISALATSYHTGSP
jgi:uncharacterized protein YbjT (DUF2867 family)